MITGQLFLSASCPGQWQYIISRFPVSGNMSVKPERILGIDPGTVVTGYGVIERTGTTLRYLDSGVVAPGRKGTMPERLAEIYRGVEALLIRYEPDVLVVEEAFYGENPKTAIKLGQARGVILVLGALQGVTIAEFSPRSVKQAVVGTGKATKEQVQYMIARILSLREPPEPLDASDALAVAVCYATRPRAVSGDSKGLTRAQKQLRELGINGI